MAKHYKAAAEEQREKRDWKGIEEERPVSLAEEERDMRAAGRKLATNQDEDVDLVGAVKKLAELIEEQRASNERIAAEMRGMVTQMHDVLARVQALQNDTETVRREAVNMTLMGVGNAQEEARKITVETITKAAAESEKAIGVMVDQGKKRIERLGMVTLPDKFVSIGGWMAFVIVMVVVTEVIAHRFF